MPCWNQLSEAQKKKVRDTIPNDWEITQVYLHKDDKRTNMNAAEGRLLYGTIEVQAIRNGKKIKTLISAQPGGRGIK